MERSRAENENPGGENSVLEITNPFERRSKLNSPMETEQISSGKNFEGSSSDAEADDNVFEETEASDNVTTVAQIHNSGEKEQVCGKNQVADESLMNTGDISDPEKLEDNRTTSVKQSDKRTRSEAELNGDSDGDKRGKFFTPTATAEKESFEGLDAGLTLEPSHEWQTQYVTDAYQNTGSHEVWKRHLFSIVDILKTEAANIGSLKANKGRITKAEQAILTSGADTIPQMADEIKNQVVNIDKRGDTQEQAIMVRQDDSQSVPQQANA